MHSYRNSFHNSEYRSQHGPLEIEAWAATLLGDNPPRWLKALQRRMWKALCGIEGCTCGDEFGRR